MKGRRLVWAVLSAGLLAGSGCSLMSSRARDDAAAAAVLAARKPAPRSTAADGTPIVGIDGVEIEKVEFRPGVSSATVEHLARQQGCTGGWGAGLVSQPGPVEVYRMSCESGKVFLAKCELRQCKAM